MLTKPNLNILSIYAKNWNKDKPFWSDVLLSNFIGNINGINLTYIYNYIIDNYIADLCASLTGTKIVE